MMSSSFNPLPSPYKHQQQSTMALTYDEAKLVKGSIPALKRQGDRIATLFYQTMLEENPELNHLFNPVNMSSGKQPRALTDLILAFASNISHTWELVPKLERVAQRHASLGIQPEHYDVVAVYLLRAFDSVLRDGMGPALRVAWGKAYWVMAKMLSGREGQIYRDFGAWTGWRKFMIMTKRAETAEGDICSLELKPLGGGTLPLHRPGQYVSLRIRVPGAKYTQIRQYSLSDAPSSESYRLTIKRAEARCAMQDGLVGSRESGRSPPLGPGRSSRRSLQSNRSDGSSNGSGFDDVSFFGSPLHGVPRAAGVVSNYIIDELREGNCVELGHPTGDFTLEDDESSAPLVLISSGVGVAPLMSMLKVAMQRNSGRPVAWIQMSRSSFPLQQEVEAAKESCPRLTTHFVSTGVGSGDLSELTDAPGFGYYLEALRLDSMFLDDETAMYYICGPERLTLDMSELLTTNGVGSSRIRYELHVSGGLEV